MDALTEQIPSSDTRGYSDVLVLVYSLYVHVHDMWHDINMGYVVRKNDPQWGGATFFLSYRMVDHFVLDCVDRTHSCGIKLYDILFSSILIALITQCFFLFFFLLLLL